MSNFTGLYESYKRAVVRITVQTPNGDLATGTGFHIGDGWIVTAAHVILAGELDEVVPEQGSRKLNVERIMTNQDPRIDLAVMKTDFDLAHYMAMTSIANPPAGYVKTDHFQIGGHLDDWIGDELVLSKVLVMGYPRVPLSRNAVLIAAEGEVNAVVDKCNAPHPHFIVSCMIRGGFSGGPVLSEHGFLLGVATESLISSGQATELGYFAVLSVEPLLTMLHENRIYPGSNREIIEVLFDGTSHVDEREK